MNTLIQKGFQHTKFFSLSLGAQLVKPILFYKKLHFPGLFMKQCGKIEEILLKKKIDKNVVNTISERI